MTTENKNEIVEVQNQVELVTRENDEFVIVKGVDGKFSRKAKFKNYSSVKAETQEEKIWLFNLYEGNEENNNGLKDHVGKIIEVHDVITRQYDKINEETGATEYGVLTYLITSDKVPYVTSSKTVYFSVTRYFEMFGYPHEDGWKAKFKIGKQKGQNGDIIKVTPVFK